MTEPELIVDEHPESFSVMDSIMEVWSSADCEQQSLGRVSWKGVIEVRDPATGEMRSATWEEAVALFVKVCEHLQWNGEGVIERIEAARKEVR